ncbi:MAG TPA: peptide-methionine (S)-S-oxide reductase MsrA [Steroidobacteraceae bacterium]|nr:peptide-methionine (S)-S-oxide reductase MsrA [Steroidobacteraceae bacterium]
MRATIRGSSIAPRSWRALASCALTAGLLGASACGVSSGAAEANVTFPHAAIDNAKAAGPLQTAVLAGGCFWGTQAVFEHVKGVRRVVAGYAGGSRDFATYEQVSTGRTGHAESVQVSFDPREVSYGEILRVFFSVAHDPTELNRQGPDAGTQYRSVIFYADADQQRIARAYIAQLQQSQLFHRSIVTRVDPLAGFYPAEGYHQDFLVHHPYDPYIVYNDLPKLSNLRRVLPDDYSEHPALVAQSH